MNFVQITDFDWWHATFTVFWLIIAFIAVNSGERCGLWASGFDINLVKRYTICNKVSILHVSKSFSGGHYKKIPALHLDRLTVQ